MRLRATALFAALAMLGPVTVVAGTGTCEAEVTIAGTCCCDPTAEQQPPEHPTIERLCCCELTKVSASPRSIDLFAPTSAPELVAAAPAAVVFDELDRLAPSATVIVAHARGPPPTSLLSQRTSYLC